MLLKNKKIVSSVLISGLLAGMAFQGTANAAAADRNKKGVEGSVTCGGTYYTRNGGKEIQRSTYILRNVSDKGIIYLDRFRVYNATGTILFDSDASGLPASYNSVITAADNALDPRQTANYRVADLVSQQGNTTRPLQTVIEKFKTYLFHIAHNKLIDYYRSKQNAKGDIVSYEDQYDDSLNQLASDEGPDNKTDVSKKYEYLLTLLEKLPAAQRDVFLMHEEAGMTLLEIAEVMNVSRDTVKSRLRYAMQRLRQGMRRFA